MAITIRRYDAYGSLGHVPRKALTAFAGNRVEEETGCYALDSRTYSPGLRRFLSADSASPFGDGGLNRYTYCGGDPVNRVDPSGSSWWTWLKTQFSLRGSDLSSQTPTTFAQTVVAQMDTTPKARLAWVTGAGAGSTKHDALGLLRTGLDARRGRIPSSSQRAKSLPSNQPRAGRVTIVRPNTSPPHSRGHAPQDRVRIKPAWKAFSVDNDKSTQWVVDSAMLHDDIDPVLKEIAKFQTNPADPIPVYILSGVHGRRDGMNWPDYKRGYPLHNDHLRREEERRPYYAHVARSGKNTIFDNLAGITEHEMIEKLRRRGHTIHAYCFSAADAVVMNHLQVAEVTVRVP